MPTLRFKLPNLHTTATQTPVSTSTHLETSSSESSETSAESCSPYLPPELISLVLLKLWEVPQPLQERWALLKNIALVNRAWLALITRVSCEDVHISSTRQANAFLRLLPRSSPAQNVDDPFTTEGFQVANEVCRSITFYVASNFKAWTSPLSERPITTADDAASAIRLVLDTVSTHSHLPNLRHVSLQYKNWDYDDAFAHLERGTFPQQVTSLSVHYSFSDSSGVDQFAMAIDWKSARQRARHARTLCGTQPIRVPTLRHLSLSEVTTDFGLDILEVCPNVETLELENVSEAGGLIRVPAITPLPPSVRTLVLRHPGAALSEREILCPWGLHTALRDGLFPRGTTGTKPRIVVRSGPVEPVVFARVRRVCEQFDAELAYERDDLGTHH